MVTGPHRNDPAASPLHVLPLFSASHSWIPRVNGERPFIPKGAARFCMTESKTTEQTYFLSHVSLEAFTTYIQQPEIWIARPSMTSTWLCCLESRARNSLLLSHEQRLRKTLRSLRSATHSLTLDCVRWRMTLSLFRQIGRPWQWTNQRQQCSRTHWA